MRGRRTALRTRITVIYETDRQWCHKPPPKFSRIIKKRQGQFGDAWYLDEVFITIQGQQLWRAVDQDSDTFDILVQKRWNK